MSSLSTSNMPDHIQRPLSCFPGKDSLLFDSELHPHPVSKSVSCRNGEFPPGCTFYQSAYTASISLNIMRTVPKHSSFSAWLRAASSHIDLRVKLEYTKTYICFRKDLSFRVNPCLVNGNTDKDWSSLTAIQ